MRIGVPREVKNGEFRVALTPAGANELVRRGHEVVVQAGAGAGSAMADHQYSAVGAEIAPDAESAWGCELVCKVKEPVESEFRHLREDLTLFTFLHLAAAPELTHTLLAAGTTAIAYETVQLSSGQLPLLYPMSEVAGCLAPQVAAFHLTATQGGPGMLLGGIGGVPNAKVVILGAGTAGQNAANIARGMCADVTLLDTDLDKLRNAYWRWEGSVRQLASDDLTIRREVQTADVVIGSVLVPGGRAPRLVTNEMVAGMKPGSMLVDIAIDQGGCFEDSRPTTHADPTFQVHGSTFYCVTNMPGAVPHTSTIALTNSTTPYITQLAEHGWREAMRANQPLALGLNTQGGRLTNGAVAEALGEEAVSVEDALR